jgi:hypothetical protein
VRSRAEETEQRRQSHIDADPRPRGDRGGGARELAKEDVSGIDAWSDGRDQADQARAEHLSGAPRTAQIRLEDHLNGRRP